MSGTHKETPRIEKPIPVRMRLVIVLTLFLIKMIAPWQYDHQFKEFWAEVKAAIRSK